MAGVRDLLGEGVVIEGEGPGYERGDGEGEGGAREVGDWVNWEEAANWELSGGGMDRDNGEG